MVLQNSLRARLWIRGSRLPTSGCTQSLNVASCAGARPLKSCLIAKGKISPRHKLLALCHRTSRGLAIQRTVARGLVGIY